jgi:ParB family chromosome partitioning protein
MADQRIIELDPGELQPNPLQPRGTIAPDSIMDLVDSIREHGVLEPLVVAHTPAGYQIIAGERRWRAAKLAGLSRVPVIVKETSPQGMLEMALVENVQREDLHPLERGKAFERLIEEFSLSHAEISKRIGKSTSYVSNSLKLLTLPDALKDGLLSGLISEGHARALLGIKDSSLMIEAYKIILKESGSVRRAEDLARRMKRKAGIETKAFGGYGQKKRLLHEESDEMEQEMTKALGDQAQVKVIRTERQSKIYITLKGSPSETEPQVEQIYRGITGAKAKS